MRANVLLIPGARMARHVACAVLLGAVAQPVAEADRYVRAAVDDSGRLRIETAGGVHPAGAGGTPRAGG